MERKTIITVFVSTVIMLITVVLYAQEGKQNRSDWIRITNDTSIYDNNNHSAFTSLMDWDGNMLVAFREAGFHKATETDKGIIHVLQKSKADWKPQHTFVVDGEDLRDPCFLSFNNKLFLYTNNYYSEYTKDGWSDLKPLKYHTSYSPGIWKLRVHNQVAYCVGYRMGKWPLLMKSEDGENWYVINEFKLGGDASEADMVFVGDTMYICIRLDSPAGSNSMWGKSVYPYTELQWTMMDVSIASPEMSVYSNKTILLAGREYDFHRKEGKDKIYVSLLAVDTDGRVKRHFVVDELGLDKGYPSFCRKKRSEYMMSYYTGTRANMTSIRLLSFKIIDHTL